MANWRLWIVDYGMLQSLARCAPGDCPLMSTRSPGAASSLIIQPPQQLDATVELFSSPARFAASAMVAATFPMAIR